MTHSLSSLLGSGQSERIRGFGGVFLGGVIGEGGEGTERGGWLVSLACFAAFVIAGCCTSFSLCLLSLAAADVNTNGWLQLFTRKGSLAASPLYL